MRPDRQADAGVGGHPRDPATDRREDDARGDRAVPRLDADDAVAVAEQAGHRRVLEDVDAALRRTRGECPGDTVVPRGRSLDVVRGAEDRVAAAAGQVDLRDELLELGRGDHEGLGATGGVHQGAGALGAHRHLGVGDPEDALGLVEDLGAGLVLERLVHLERVLVEADRLGDAVVGADDRGVAAGVARGDVVGLEDRHVRDAVAGREVVGGRQAVPAAADDDDVVARLRRVRPADRRERVGVGAHRRRLASSSA